MDADAELDALIGRYSEVALDHRILNRDGAAHGFDDAAELDQRTVAGALEHAAVLARDGRIEEVGAKRPQPRERAILVHARHAAEAGDIGGEDRRDFTGLGHSSGIPALRRPANIRSRQAAMIGTFAVRRVIKALYCATVAICPPASTE